MHQRIAEIETRLKEIPTLRTSLFEDKAKGLLSKESFADIMEQMDEETENKQQELDMLNEKLKAQTDHISAVNVFIQRLKNHRKCKTLSPEMVEDLIARITVEESKPAENKHLKELPAVHIYYMGIGLSEDFHP